MYMKEARMKPIIKTLMAVLLLPVATAEASVATIANVPDSSQHANAGWSNYCAPTCGGDVVYYFSNTYASLRQGNPYGPGALADSGATAIIGGNAPGSPPPPAGSLAQRMGTTLAGGTTAVGLMTGLDGYLEDNWDATVGGNDWNTIYISPGGPGGMGGATFWQTLQNETDAGSGIVLCIAWQQGVPGAPYDVPDPYSGSDSPESAIGHAVVMVGYNTNGAIPIVSINDPANNAGIHNWAGEYANYNLGVGANSLTIQLGGVQGTIYGAVITNIPSPGALALLGLAGLFGKSRRRR
jgi:hypothetical protein